MNQSARTSRYLPGLDGLRAIAILGIVLYHMFPGAVRGGYLGVTMFFVLSGFLLARTAAANYDQGRWSAGAFYQKRIRRIYPALLWVIALTLLALQLWLPDGLVGIREELESILFGYQNWWQIVQNQDYFSRITSTSPFTHMWSLAVELQYYLGRCGSMCWATNSPMRYGASSSARGSPTSRFRFPAVPSRSPSRTC